MADLQRLDCDILLDCLSRQKLQPNQFTLLKQEISAVDEKTNRRSNVLSFLKQGENIRILILGKTGSGKSSTGNTLLGTDDFDTKFKLCSGTSQCKLKTYKRNKCSVEILDCPGLYDTTLTDENIGDIILRTVGALHPGPTAILYVITLADRYTSDQFDTYKKLKRMFDDNITRHMVVLFTHGDALEGHSKDEVRDIIEHDSPSELQQVLRECGNRYVIFNNNAKHSTKQLKRLVDVFRDMVDQNNNEPYMCPRYEKIGKEIEKEVSRRQQAQLQASRESGTPHLTHNIINVKDLSIEEEEEKEEEEGQQQQQQQQQKEAGEEKEENLPKQYRSKEDKPHENKSPHGNLKHVNASTDPGAGKGLKTGGSNGSFQRALQFWEQKAGDASHEVGRPVFKVRCIPTEKRRANEEVEKSIDEPKVEALHHNHNIQPGSERSAPIKASIRKGQGPPLEDIDEIAENEEEMEGPKNENTKSECSEKKRSPWAEIIKATNSRPGRKHPHHGRTLLRRNKVHPGDPPAYYCEHLENVKNEMANNGSSEFFNTLRQSLMGLFSFLSPVRK
ncbi:GTPase IMAP family member 4-like [Littorina saxatilis]|uniref:GTPase IMAP family member 4-like n=1 Tax=Littorina saxatilis TaxID=31220 RepID=UPI0038B578AA